MKILIVGSLSNYAIERYYFKYLDKNIDPAIECKVFGAQDIFLEYYTKGLFNKLLFRLGYWDILNQINQQLKAIIEDYQPDFLWVFKGMEIFPDTLKWVRSKKIKLISYNPDNPFLFSGRGSGNSNITACIGLYDLHLTYDTEISTRIINEYKIPTAILPFGFDISTSVHESFKRNLKEIQRACFVGNPDKHRAAFLLKIAEAGIKIDVYGNKWSKFLHHKNITTFDSVSGDDFWNTLYRYRVQLNLMRPHNPHSHNMRTFEVPGVGGILLAPKTKDHSEFFTDGKEIYLYNDIGDCISKLNYILKLVPSEAQKIREQARSRSIISGYSYQGRSNEFLAILKNLLE